MNTYRANIKIFYNDIKVKKFSRKEKYFFFSTRKYIRSIFPLYFLLDNEIQNFDENYFLPTIGLILKLENELINFILPLEDLEDISKIIEMKEYNRRNKC